MSPIPSSPSKNKRKKVLSVLLQQRQVKEGIDAVIVDSVLAIRKGLTAHEEEKKAKKETAAAVAAARFAGANGTNGTSGAAAANAATVAAANGTGDGEQSSGNGNGDLPPEIARIVDTVNGVPVYASKGDTGDPVNGAVF